MKPSMDSTEQSSIKQIAGNQLGNIAGYVGTRVMNIGLEMNIFDQLANQTDGITCKKLAEFLDYNEKYLQVWLDSAYAFDQLKMENGAHTWLLLYKLC